MDPAVENLCAVLRGLRDARRTFRPRGVEYPGEYYAAQRDSIADIEAAAALAVGRLRDYLDKLPPM